MAVTRIIKRPNTSLAINMIMKSKIMIWFLSTILRFCFAMIFFTCRWKIHNEKKFKKYQLSDKPILLCSWHSRFLFVARFFKSSRINIWGISSSHRDSEIMAKILLKWNWKLIRGSSTRGWSHVIRTMKSKLKNATSIIAITNDGPRGPAKIAKPGSIKLALQHNAYIMSMSCCASKYWKIPSWDQTMIPKPFSTIHVKFDEPMNYEKAKNEVDALNNYLNNNLSALDESII